LLDQKPEVNQKGYFLLTSGYYLNLMAQNAHVKRIYSLFIPNNKKQLVSDYFSANSEFIHKKG
jgi:hypothetical protein